MPVVRIDNYRDAYRIRAGSEDVHELAGRPNKNAITEAVNRRILEALELTPEDVLVDIGCGDASLLRMAGGRVAKSIGIVVSEEEKRRLETSFPGLSVVASRAQKLPLESGSASKVVCNGTLHYLVTDADVQAALREMARIARRGAMIWVGEVSEVDEFVRHGMYRGNSMLAYLWHLLRHNGVRTFLGMVRRWLKAMVGKEQIVLNSAGLFYAPPEKFMAMAEASGLRLKTHFRHQDLDGAGNLVDSAFRYDYIFTV